MGNPLGVALLIFAVAAFSYGANCMFQFFIGFWGERSIKVGCLLKGIISILTAFFIFVVITSNAEYFELKRVEPNSTKLATE
ncbi:hypothetical protein C3B51_13170 [Pseudoalteromonas rubra]|uniref:Uncharacterized protein n=1 Tax=Pseudoalteromonas rubra TaxID=43658 RepID=A0A4Q7EFJ2_9GAMM|nr:hypothetical protein C3B51_13170 [Pseudoalteromonas rubra]